MRRRRSSPSSRRRAGRRVLLAVLATAAAVLLVVGIVAALPDRKGVFVAGQPGSPAPLQFVTHQVSFVADGMVIDAGGQKFTAGGAAVDVNSDPGTRDKYTTLELIWNERGVEMRLFVYFTSDGHNWWANALRTYNGKASGDWIDYSGKFFSAPLGQAFTGTDVNLTADDGGGHLHFSNLRLQAFLPPAACKNATAKYALDAPYSRVDLPAGANGFGLGTTALLDTASCTVVTDPQAYSYDVGGRESGGGEVRHVRREHDLAPHAARRHRPEHLRRRDADGRGLDDAAPDRACPGDGQGRRDHRHPRRRQVGAAHRRLVPP